MPKKKSFLNDLAKGVPLSEPFNTFLSNMDAVLLLTGTSLITIKKELEEVESIKEQTARGIEMAGRRFEETTQALGELYKIQRELEGTPSVPAYRKMIAEVQNLIKSGQATAKESKHSLEQFSSISNRCLLFLYSDAKQLEILMPMVFVYQVVIWDAFVFDTARKILGAHPNLIWLSKDTSELNKSTLWNAKSLEEIRDYLIEHEVRQLDKDRKKLVTTFKEYWGIDWEASTISLDDVTEIRARRDIWVHNRGLINKQYLDMIGDSDSSKIGQVAEITNKYLLECTITLTKLAAYIHKVAHKKHYA